MNLLGLGGIGNSMGMGMMNPMMLAQLLGAGMSPGMGMGMPMANQFNFNFGGRDGFNPSADLFDMGGMGMGLNPFAGRQFGALGGQGLLGMGSPMGMGGMGGFSPFMSGMGGMGGFSPMGMGGGFGSPMMGGMGNMQQMLPMMAMMMMAMGRMMGQMAQQQRGMQPPFNGGMNPIGMQRPPGQGGGPIQLQKGQTYTTPGGATISWKGDQVKVDEKGGSAGAAAGAGASQKGQGAFAFAGAMQQTPYGTAFAMAGAAIGGPQGAGFAGSGASSQAQPRNWMVHGDPHIKNPDGSKGEFSDGAKGAETGGLFTLQDGTRVCMQAKDAKGVVESVLIYPPGTQLSGFDPNKVTDYGDAANGKFQSKGTVAQTGGGDGGFGVSPFGNNFGGGFGGGMPFGGGNFNQMFFV